MKTYEVEFNEQQDKGIYAVSLVEDPAMEGMFIALNKQEQIKLAKVDEEQRILLGVALVPDKPILRLTDEGEEFQIIFRKDTIKKSAHAFFKNNYNNNSSLEHETRLSGVSFVESWIIDDEKNDKSRAYGIKEPVGSWMVAMKVDSDEVWNEYVKTGAVKGFSIDGLFSLKEVKLKSDINMSNKQKGGPILDALKKAKSAIDVALGNTKEVELKDKAEVKLGQVAMMDGTMIEFEGETLEKDSNVFVMSGDERVPLPVGEYPLDGGMVLVVAEEGVASEVKEMVSEEEAEVEMESDGVMDAPEDVDYEAKKKLADAFDKIDKMMAQMSAIEKSIKEKDAENEKLKAELAKTPEVAPIKHKDNTLKVELTEKGRILKAMRKNK
jgi:hypothetical protein